ncbi:MAG: transporter [Phycisphaeraceae bacterium]|nr:transporter [Phycisphaerales bacterium]MCB9841856.1 transporter [Phycisphaeraceae bacterium]
MPRIHSVLLVAVAALAAVFMPVREARAQAPIVSQAATQPAKGRLSIREQFMLMRMDNDPSGEDREVRQTMLHTIIDYGLTGNQSLSLRLPVIFRRINDDDQHGRFHEDGIGDLTAIWKYRLWQHDTGPIGTKRFSIFAGAEIPVGNEDLTSDSFDPIIGVVYTQVQGRHGLNVDASWKFTTGGDDDGTGVGDSLADLLRVNASYLYRIAPEQYQSDTNASWYAVAELNGMYETNGDTEVMLSPGLLYEHRRWAAEIGVQLPILQDVDHRLEHEWVFIVGVRFLF